MKIAYIMRGVPGSGKTTIAKKLAGDKGIIHSTDEYFMVDGVYRFDIEKLAEYHDLNYNAFCESLDKGIEVVICDNTNIEAWHYERYVKSAQSAGYIVAFVVLPHPDPKIAAKRNHHGIFEGDIQHMIELWED